MSSYVRINTVACACDGRRRKELYSTYNVTKMIKFKGVNANSGRGGVCASVSGHTCLARRRISMCSREGC